MKKSIFIFISIFVIFCSTLVTLAASESFHANAKTTQATPKMAIVIDDFGSYNENGITTLLQADIPITAAVLPNTDNTKPHLELLQNKPYEIILHMPMQASVNFPENYYGPIYIKTHDTPATVREKLDSCLQDFNGVKGFNIHIGSGVSRNKQVMTAIYDYAKEHGLYFLDSRTIETNAVTEACKDTNSVYLGRDVFLEADKNRSYSGVKFRLSEGIKLAKEKGYSIVIGHVGAEGGENTAKAIVDMIPEFEAQGVKIVPLSEIYEYLK